jgi:hypothetical protein
LEVLRDQHSASGGRDTPRMRQAIDEAIAQLRHKAQEAAKAE